LALLERTWHRHRRYVKAWLKSRLAESDQPLAKKSGKK
jgi:hypothetical protein